MRRIESYVFVFVLSAVLYGCNSKWNNDNPLALNPNVGMESTKAAHAGGSLDEGYILKVSAYKEENESTGPGQNYFVGLPFRSGEDGWVSAPVRYWPLGGVLNLLCIAYPDELDPILSGGLQWNRDDCAGAVSVEVPDASCLESEVLYGALTTEQRTGAAGLVLEHSQTWLEFRIGIDTELEGLVRVDGLTLKQVCAGGELRLTNREFLQSEWNFRHHSYMDVSVPGFPVEVNGTEQITAGVLLPPQEQGAVEFTYRVRTDVSQSWDESVIRTSTFPAGVKIWTPGKKNVYKVSVSLKTVSVNLIVEPWEGSETTAIL